MAEGQQTMNTDNAFPRVVFPEGFDDRSAVEIEMKGCLIGAVVVLEDGSQYPVSFLDPARLRQDLEAETALGHPCLWEAGLVVLPSVTVESILQAIPILIGEGFLDYLRPLRNGAPYLHYAGRGPAAGGGEHQ